ncbi:DeoR/GlpR family DNA-binding transcription regulator [Caldicellulosiruptoraceae bacterium PP1]
MFEEERKQKIVQYVQEHLRASVQELSYLFNVSESTIRRDLKELEDAKLIKRTHGGAVSLESVNFEPTFIEKEDKFKNEKEKIAKKASEFIQKGDTILIDSGTTTLYLAKELKKVSDITVVTNSIIIAYELQTQDNIEIVIIGGTLRKNTRALVGPISEYALNMLRVDKAFIATNGIDVEEGLTTPNIIEAATKRKMIEISKETILLADHSKVGKVSFAQFADISDIDKWVTDEKVEANIISRIENKGTTIYIANY